MNFYVGNRLTIVKKYGATTHNKINNPCIDLKIIKIHRKCKCKQDTSYGGFFDYVIGLLCISI